MRPLADLAQRATVTGLAGLGVWGVWLTLATWKSRHGDGAIPAPAAPGQHPMHKDQKQHAV